MNDALLLLILVLVTYRLTVLICEDYIFSPVRNFVGTVGNDFIREYLGYLIHCPYCLGIWIALILAIIYYPSQWFLMTLAIAGGQVFLQKVTEDDQ